MADRKLCFMLFCDAANGKFVLACEGEDWREYFCDLEMALRFAGERVEEEVPLTIYNELGKIIVESTVTPNQLAQPRVLQDDLSRSP